jgi:hypothetical protein
MAAYAIRKYADSCDRLGLDITELRRLGCLLEPRDETVTPERDAAVMAVQRRREKSAARSRAYRQRRREERRSAA